MTTEINVITADNKQVQAKIAHVTTLVSKSVNELGGLFLDLCERFTGKDSQTGSNFENLLNGLEGSKGAKRYQTAIIARLNDFSQNTLTIEYNEETKKYSVETKKGADKKSLFKKDYFIEAVTAAKSAEFALNAPAKTGETGSKKPRKFNPVKAQVKVEESLKDFATKLAEAENLTPERLAIKLDAMLKDVLLQIKPAIEGETV
ncbi:hypothetical protein RWE39_004393 [Salmonella enterica]|nr:hypothetical protein [Salmonella enterica]EMD5616190.1 hypothetical protein [Salmonella enterica]